MFWKNIEELLEALRTKLMPHVAVSPDRSTIHRRTSGVRSSFFSIFYEEWNVYRNWLLDSTNGRINGKQRPGPKPYAQSEYQYDAFGRLWRERRLLPSGSWTTKETIYDNMSRPFTSSEWDTVLSPTAKSTLYYDWAGRVTKQTPPDGTTHDVTFGYTGSRLKSRTVKIATASGVESSSTTTEEYDGLGRLWKVTEPSGTRGAKVATRYTYDGANRLTQVCGGFVSSYAQTRTFTYDGRGLLPPRCIRSGRLRRTLTSMRTAMRHASAPGRQWEAHSTCG